MPGLLGFASQTVAALLVLSGLLEEFVAAGAGRAHVVLVARAERIAVDGEVIGRHGSVGQAVYHGRERPR
ncbi:MAG: hypothetical protein QOE43_618 [Gaiellaceae bacterium]|jgi:high-affinity K+ transport system ATPase subunit B|nr:hypothetical protein [Gaiellaceae bacterium]